MRRAQAAAILLTGALALAACGGAATPTPAPTPTPTPAPTATPTAAPTPSPAPTAAPTASPGGTAAPDVAVGLEIDAPFELTAVDPTIDALFREQWSGATGAFGELMGLGTRQVTQDGTLKAFLIVIEFPAAFVESETFWPSLLAGMASQGGGEAKTETIDGVEVRIVEGAEASFGLFLLDQQLMVVIPPSASDVLPICEALIGANA